VRSLSHHLARLRRDCRAVFGADLDTDEVRAFVRQEVEQTGARNMGIRVTVFAPTMDLGRPASAPAPSVLVSVRPAAVRPAPPLRVQSRRYEREHPTVKHIGLLGALWERREAQLMGYDDALFMDSSRFVSEGPTWNIGFWDGSRVVWPSAAVLPGVTMHLLHQVHDATVTTPVNLLDIPQMRAAFATNVTVGVRPIVDIDGVRFPDDSEIIAELRAEFDEIPGESL
jgi:branched-subunit amino acid aminotransferase/4-amino-4-deoxychorismate lyase